MTYQDSGCCDRRAYQISGPCLAFPHRFSTRQSGRRTANNVWEFASSIRKVRLGFEVILQQCLRHPGADGPLRTIDDVEYYRTRRSAPDTKPSLPPTPLPTTSAKLSPTSTRREVRTNLAELGFMEAATSLFRLACQYGCPSHWLYEEIERCQNTDRAKAYLTA